MSPPIVVSQVALANDLMITDRRVRQLVAQGIFDEGVVGIPNAKGYDLDECRSRYRVYSLNTLQGWERYYEKRVDEIKASRLLTQAAMGNGATMENVRQAIHALERLASRIRFVMAAKDEPSGRSWAQPLMQSGFDREVGALAYRALELIAAETGATADQLVSSLSQ